jgi:hypothetical protein
MWSISYTLFAVKIFAYLDRAISLFRVHELPLVTRQVKNVITKMNLYLTLSEY